MKTLAPIRNLILNTLLGFFWLTANAQIDVVPILSDKSPDMYEGFYYALPRTVLRIEVLVEETEQVRGPFADYANRMLGLTNIVKTSSLSYKIVAINISTYSEADPSQYFYVRMPLKEIQPLDVSFNPDATLRSVQLSKPEGRKKASTKIIREETQQVFADISMPDVVERVDTVVSRISLDTITFERITFPKTYIEKSPEQKAREAADYILKLEDDRMKLLSGFQEVGYSMEAIKYMNEQIRQVQDEYRALFKGKIRSLTFQQAFIFVPDAESDGNAVTLFRFSPSRGVIDKNSTEGEPVILQFNSMNMVASLKNHEPKRKSAKRLTQGLYYRIPEKARFVVKRGAETLSEKDFLVNQLGVLSYLPTRGVSVIEMHPQTGSIMRLKLR